MTAEALILHFLSYVRVASRERLIRYLALEWGITPKTTCGALSSLLRRGVVTRLSHGKYGLGKRQSECAMVRSAVTAAANRS